MLELDLMWTDAIVWELMTAVFAVSCVLTIVSFITHELTMLRVPTWSALGQIVILSTYTASFHALFVAFILQLMTGI